jgi:hypothetical protein
VGFLLSMPDLFKPPMKVVRSETADTPVSGTLPGSSSTVDASYVSKADALPAPTLAYADQTEALPTPLKSLPAVKSTPPVVPFPSPSAYVLQTCICPSSKPEDASLGLANDPRLFFAGAPSSFHNDFVGCVLRQANREARVPRNRTISWIPSGVCAITRLEKLTFEDEQACTGSKPPSSLPRSIPLLKSGPFKHFNPCPRHNIPSRRTLPHRSHQTDFHSGMKNCQNQEF